MEIASGPQILNTRIHAKAAILIRYLVLLMFWIGIDFLKKNPRPFLSFCAFSLSFCGTFFIDKDPFSHYLGWSSASSLLSFSFIKSTLCWVQERLDDVPSIIPFQHSCFDIFDLAVSGVKESYFAPRCITKRSSSERTSSPA